MKKFWGFKKLLEWKSKLLIKLNEPLSNDVSTSEYFIHMINTVVINILTKLSISEMNAIILPALRKFSHPKILKTSISFTLFFTLTAFILY